jgi:hypothetical protein
VWVDPDRTLGNGSDRLNITAVRTAGPGSTTFDPITERNTTKNGVTVWNRNLSNGRITWDASAGGGAGGYALTTDPTDAGLYFMFGGVAGIFTGTGAVATRPGTGERDTFDAGDVAWSPVAVNVWDDIPMYDGWPSREVDAAYHTAANVKAGKGDPCRLVGLDLNHIATTDAGSLTAAQIDNGIWRLPTRDENGAFVGIYDSPAYWRSLDGVNGYGFPGDDTFLPIVGYRLNGTVTSQDLSGFYWSSTARDGGTGYNLFFLPTGVYSLNDIEYGVGFSIRCVRQ